MSKSFKHTTDKSEIRGRNATMVILDDREAWAKSRSKNPASIELALKEIAAALEELAQVKR